MTAPHLTIACKLLNVEQIDEIHPKLIGELNDVALLASNCNYQQLTSVQVVALIIHQWEKEHPGVYAIHRFNKG